jgi:hypothetical protein
MEGHKVPVKITEGSPTFSLHGPDYPDMGRGTASRWECAVVKVVSHPDLIGRRQIVVRMDVPKDFEDRTDESLIETFLNGFNPKK